MADKDQEKTEEATPQRREEFRQKGQVAQTRELSSVMLLMGFALLIFLMSRFFSGQVTELYDVLYGSNIIKFSHGDQILDGVMFAFTKCFYILTPVFVLLLILALCATVFQVGFLFSEEAMKPNLSKINPIEGFKRIFSLKAVVEGIKAFAKLLMVGTVAYLVVKSDLVTFPKLLFFSTSQTFAFLNKLIMKMVLGTGSLMMVIALADYLFQRFDLEKQMRMTKQEVKEEMKSREGDPLIKSRIRKAQKDMAQKRMMSDVVKADVIITNPTHIAVAIKYNSQEHAAPQILAMGRDFVVERIKKLAKEKEIPIVENKPLARTMFRTLEVGSLNT